MSSDLIEVKHIYWIAAFLDGEGSFSYNGSPNIQVSSTDKDLIEKFLGFSRIVSIIHVMSPRQIEHKIQYKVSLRGNLSIQWMMTIYPLMCERRKKRIREVLSIWKNSMVPYENRTHCPKGHPYNGNNLMIDTVGGRRCRICRRATHRKWKISKHRNISEIYDTRS